jgi:hypothetical protein
MTISSSKHHDETTQSAEPSTQTSRIKRPIWEVVAEIGAKIPDEEWAKVPDDGSMNYKHYLYGVPKQNQ